MSPGSSQSRTTEAVMTGGDKEGKGVSGAEQSWRCFRNAKGQGLSPSPWPGRCCPSLLAQGSSQDGHWDVGMCNSKGRTISSPCQAAEQGQGGHEAPGLQGSLVSSSCFSWLRPRASSHGQSAAGIGSVRAWQLLHMPVPSAAQAVLRCPCPAPLSLQAVVIPQPPQLAGPFLC